MNQTEHEHRRTFEWEATRGPSYAVVEAVAGVADVDPLEMEPLHRAVDPDALDGIFGPTAGADRRSDGCVEFDYAGYRVVVKSHGRGYVYERESEQPATAR